ncbi:YdhK family protein [Georgenia satyanarayanai]|uniref:YdhK family protein n=1 Tax=Georgenia satyanarayanai TaxID=860221 RepID=UPI00203C1F9D|nr:YdhK family protein [Georgenia satyanarayanai]MCM3661508.1 YdhK family protein [Georgenia satyanarayanai]
MRAAARLALYGAGLVVAFGGAYGLAGVVVPDGAVESWAQQSQVNGHSEGADDMNSSSHGQQEAGGMAGHDHPTDGGTPPAGIQTATDPTYPVGTEVILAADHMPGMDGAEATISGAFTTTTYSVSYTPIDDGEPVVDHKWVVHEELESPGAAPLVDGTQVVLEAEHMAGMQGATATIDHSTQETVYMVDIESDEMTMTNHKWVVESEIHPAH